MKKYISKENLLNGIWEVSENCYDKQFRKYVSIAYDTKDEDEINNIIDILLDGIHILRRKIECEDMFIYEKNSSLRE